MGITKYHHQPHLPILTSYFPKWKPGDYILWCYNSHTLTPLALNPPHTLEAAAEAWLIWCAILSVCAMPACCLPLLIQRAGVPGAWRGSNVHQWAANYHAELSGTDGQPLTVLDGYTHTHTHAHTSCFTQEVKKPRIFHTSEDFFWSIFEWIQPTSHKTCSVNIY